MTDHGSHLGSSSVQQTSKNEVVEQLTKIRDTLGWISVWAFGIYMLLVFVHCSPTRAQSNPPPPSTTINPEG